MYNNDDALKTFRTVICSRKCYRRRRHSDRKWQFYLRNETLFKFYFKKQQMKRGVKAKRVKCKSKSKLNKVRGKQKASEDHKDKTPFNHLPEWGQTPIDAGETQQSKMFFNCLAQLQFKKCFEI